jgi:hypothetical protein
MLYRLFVPSQAVGASLVYFDLFNIGTSHDMEVVSVKPIVSGAVAVTGVVGVDLFMTRTTAVGTGGTAATVEGTSLTAATISAVDSSQPANLTVVSARLTPTGGATAGAVLTWGSVFTEETSSGAYEQSADLTGGVPVVIKSGTGIRVAQGAVASVGNVGFNVLFNLKARG